MMNELFDYHKAKVLRWLQLQSVLAHWLMSHWGYIYVQR